MSSRITQSLIRLCGIEKKRFFNKQEEANKSKPILDAKSAVDTPAATETK